MSKIEVDFYKGGMRSVDGLVPVKHVVNVTEKNLADFWVVNGFGYLDDGEPYDEPLVRVAHEDVKAHGDCDGTCKCDDGSGAFPLMNIKSKKLRKLLLNQELGRLKKNKAGLRAEKAAFKSKINHINQDLDEIRRNKTEFKRILEWEDENDGVPQIRENAKFWHELQVKSAANLKVHRAKQEAEKIVAAAEEEEHMRRGR